MHVAARFALQGASDLNFCWHKQSARYADEQRHDESAICFTAHCCTAVSYYLLCNENNLSRLLFLALNVLKSCRRLKKQWAWDESVIVSPHQIVHSLLDFHAFGTSSDSKLTKMGSSNSPFADGQTPFQGLAAAPTGNYGCKTSSFLWSRE